MRTRVRDESGVTLIELMVVVVLLVLVMAAMLSLLDTTARIAPQDQEQSVAVRDAQSGLDRMTRELRQGYQVVARSGTVMDVLVTLRQPDGSGGYTAVDRRVKYDCGELRRTSHPNGSLVADDPRNPIDQNYRRCVRYEGPTDTAQPLGAGRVVIDRVLNGTPNQAGNANYPAVFTYPNDQPGVPSYQPKYVEAQVVVPGRGEGRAGFKHAIVLDDGFFLRNLALTG